VDPKTVAAILD
jgi:hypothetical protein